MQSENFVKFIWFQVSTKYLYQPGACRSGQLRGMLLLHGESRVDQPVIIMIKTGLRMFKRNDKKIAVTKILRKYLGPTLGQKSCSDKKDENDQRPGSNLGSPKQSPLLALPVPPLETFEEEEKTKIYTKR